MRRGRRARSLLPYAYTRVDGPAGLLDLPAVFLLQLYKLSVEKCVCPGECSLFIFNQTPEHVVKLVQIW